MAVLSLNSPFFQSTEQQVLVSNSSGLLSGVVYPLIRRILLGFIALIWDRPTARLSASRRRNRLSVLALSIF